MSPFTGAILASLIANALSFLAKQLLPQSTAETQRGRLLSKLLQNDAPLSDIRLLVPALLEVLQRIRPGSVKRIAI